ncbi:hypothetical protein M3Y94_00514300 [Aphelenchoides besseyi]|nr:hypothetical protein M3Y94_00514300 [Aphelenchoides besseyi]KAI6226024.1 hypothetical protein M3Y95_00758500 [Aphelenchoides besseyi]
MGLLKKKRTVDDPMGNQLAKKPKRKGHKKSKDKKERRHHDKKKKNKHRSKDKRSKHGKVRSHGGHHYEPRTPGAVPAQTPQEPEPRLHNLAQPAVAEPAVPPQPQVQPLFDQPEAAATRTSFPAFVVGQRGGVRPSQPEAAVAPLEVQQPPVKPTAVREEPVELKRVLHIGETDDSMKRDSTLKCIQGLMGFMDFNAHPNDPVRDATQVNSIGPEEQPAAQLPAETPQVEKSVKLVDFARNCLEVDILDASRVFAHIASPGPPTFTHVASDQNSDYCRFEDVHCIDQSRVLLQRNESPNPFTDFIHANRFPLDKKRQMIITQLPTTETASHFWQMIVQEQVEAMLLILTRHECDLFVKGEGILPENGCLHLENGIRVIQQQEIAITPQITHYVYNLMANGQSRTVHLYHYYEWYHDIAPNTSHDIWKLHSILRKYNQPIVCMSLSGSGRAGTYATFELLNSQLHDPAYYDLSIVDAIETVRKSRFAAVQSPTQLAFIAMAFLDRFLISRKLKPNLPSDVKSTFVEMKSSLYEKISAKDPPPARN